MNDDVPPGIDPKLWHDTHINEEHLQAFARALDLSDAVHNEEAASPASPVQAPRPEPGWDGGVEKLTATSDFAPIHSRVRKRRGKNAHSLGLTYHLIRWPLLAFLFLIIWLEFSIYVVTRQFVNLFEWGVAWRGMKRSLRRNLREAKTYPQWVEAACEMDDYMGLDEWKESSDDSYFDAQLVRRVRATLSRLRAQKDSRGLMEALAVCVRPNFAGTESAKMYSETFFGTKRLVEAHVQEVAACLDFIRQATDVTLEEKRGFFRGVNKNYGSSALCLSGGACMGYYHFGVVRAFLDADLLPRVITGTSAGGLIAALVCTHTDAELKQLIRPELADKITACEDPFTTWVMRWWKTGARFSSVDWARKSMFFTHGSMTFKEAYERTGRALNVSVVPADRYSPTILLNHLTAPNCTIWSAIIASAAVPGIQNPVVLMSKSRDGSLKPHNLGGSRFKDGSLREDIPLGSLHTQFNCNFSIVSQTNPHIHLFFFAPRGKVGRPVAHRKGKGWRGGFILSALESYIKLDLSKHFKVIRDLDLMPQLLQSDWSGVFLQRFSGDLTLTPRSTIRDWFHLLDDPDRGQLERMIRVGQRAAWPSLHMAGNRMVIERSIQRGRQECRLAASREKPTTDRGEAGAGTPRLQLQTQMPIESDADNAIRLREARERARQRNGGSSLVPRADDDSPGSSAFSLTKRRKGRRPLARDALDPSANSPVTPHTLSRKSSQGSSTSSPLSPSRRFGLNGGPFSFSSFAKRRNSRSTMSIARWFAGSSSESDSDLLDDEGSDPLDMDETMLDSGGDANYSFDEVASSQVESDGGGDGERQRSAVSQDI